MTWKQNRAQPETGSMPVWVVRVRGDDGELRPWYYIDVYSIESRLDLEEEARGDMLIT